MSLTKVSYSMISGASVNVLDYGAKGDGTTNDAAAITAAITACKALEANGYMVELVFPAGNYLVTFTKSSSDANYYNSYATKSFYNFVPNDWPTLTSYSNPSQKGLYIRGIGGATIIHNGDANSYLFSIGDGTSGSGYFTLNIDNLFIKASTPSIVQHAFAAYRMVHSQWNHVYFQDFQKGCATYLSACTDNTFYNFGAVSCQRAVVVGTYGGVAWGDALSNVNNFLNFEFSGCGTNFTDAQSLQNGCVEINAAQNSNFENGVFQNCNASFLVLACQGLQLKNVYFENSNSSRPAGTAYRNSIILDPTFTSLIRGTSNYIQNIRFESCYMAGDFNALIRAGSGKSVASIVWDTCSFAGYGALGYLASELPYIFGLDYKDCAIWTDGNQTALITSYPTQSTYNPATGAVTASTNYRALPIVMTSPNVDMRVKANIRASAIKAVMSGTRTNVTGDGTAYVVEFNTESFDGDQNFDTTTNTFTAPVTGFYQYSGSIAVTGLTSSHTLLQVTLLVNGSAIDNAISINPYALSSGGAVVMSFANSISLTASNTVQMRVTASNGTKVVNIAGGTTFAITLI